MRIDDICGGVWERGSGRVDPTNRCRMRSSTDGATLSLNLKLRASDASVVTPENPIKFLGLAAAGLPSSQWLLASGAPPVPNRAARPSGGVEGYQPPSKPTPKKNP